MEELRRAGREGTEGGRGREMVIVFVGLEQESMRREGHVNAKNHSCTWILGVDKFKGPNKRERGGVDCGFWNMD